MNNGYHQRISQEKVEVTEYCPPCSTRRPKTSYQEIERRYAQYAAQYLVGKRDIGEAQRYGNLTHAEVHHRCDGGENYYVGVWQRLHVPACRENPDNERRNQYEQGCQYRHERQFQQDEAKTPAEIPAHHALEDVWLESVVDGIGKYAYVTGYGESHGVDTK